MQPDFPERDFADVLNWVRGRLELPAHDPGVHPASLPTSYLEFIEVLGSGEGFIGHEYLRLFALDQLSWLNQAYNIATYLPGYYIFGSNGGGEAYFFRTTSGEPSVSRIPFIPLDTQYAEPTWPSFADFLFDLAHRPSEDGAPCYADTPNPEAIGMEVYNIKPIAFGGSPTDPKNQALVPVAEHVALVAYWNRLYRSIR